MAARKSTKKGTKRKRATRTRRMPARSRVPRIPRLSQGQLLAVKAAANPYKEAMLNPETAPLCGVPQMHPIDTHVVRVQSRKTIQFSGGTGVIIGNPVSAVSNDNSTVVYGDASSIWDVNANMLGNGLKTNSPYSASQFAEGGASSGVDVRARVVGYTLKVTNVSDDNSKNGVFTAYQEPQHHTLQGYDNAAAAKKNDAKVISAKGSIALTYNVADPIEAEGWIWNVNRGYSSGIHDRRALSSYVASGTAQFNPPAGDNHVVDGDVVQATSAQLDANEGDLMPGYMGVWWNGVGTQSFLVEVHAIVEYIGGLVTQQVKPSAPVLDLPTMSETRRAVEAANVHVPVPGHGGSGHPHSATAALMNGLGHLGHLLGQGAAAAVGDAIGGPAGGGVAAQLETQIEHLGQRAVHSGIDWLRRMF